MLSSMDNQYTIASDVLSPKIEEYETIPLVNTKSFESKLDNSSFDPSKFSPPNDFMNKLKERMSCYKNSTMLVKK